MEKDVFKRSGKFLGTAKGVAVNGGRVEIMFPGDFPGMEGKTVIFLGKVLFEDKDRIYIDCE